MIFYGGGGLVPAVHPGESVTSESSCCSWHRMVVMSGGARQSSCPIVSSCDRLNDGRRHVGRNQRSGRRNSGRRWAAAVVDVDVWSGRRAAGSGRSQAAGRRLGGVALSVRWRHQAVGQVVVVCGRRGGELAVRLVVAGRGQGVIIQWRHLQIKMKNRLTLHLWQKSNFFLEKRFIKKVFCLCK